MSFFWAFALLVLSVLWFSYHKTTRRRAILIYWYRGQAITQFVKSQDMYWPGVSSLLPLSFSFTQTLTKLNFLRVHLTQGDKINLILNNLYTLSQHGARELRTFQPFPSAQNALRPPQRLVWLYSSAQNSSTNVGSTDDAFARLSLLRRRDYFLFKRRLWIDTPVMGKRQWFFIAFAVFVVCLSLFSQLATLRSHSQEIKGITTNGFFSLFFISCIPNWKPIQIISLANSSISNLQQLARV